MLEDVGNVQVTITGRQIVSSHLVHISCTCRIRLRFDYKSLVQMGDVDEVELRRGEIAIVKYSNVWRLIQDEKLELV